MLADKGFHIPADLQKPAEAGVGFHGLRELREVRTVSLFPPAIDAIAELLLAKIVLSPSETVPLHVHPLHSEAVFVLKGCVMAQRGAARAELRAGSCAYFPAGVGHGMTGIRQGDAELLMFYPRADTRKDVSSDLVDGGDQLSWPNPNVVKGKELLWRWAVAEECEAWTWVEPTKPGLRVRLLFDPPRGASDLVIGTGMTEANHHYSLHRHAPAEFYYILGGRGVIYVGTEAYEVEQGSTIYIPSNEVHGAETYDTFLNDFWVYGLDGSGDDWVWQAVEPIYDLPKPEWPALER